MGESRNEGVEKVKIGNRQWRRILREVRKRNKIYTERKTSIDEGSVEENERMIEREREGRMVGWRRIKVEGERKGRRKEEGGEDRKDIRYRRKGGVETGEG